MKTIRRYTYKRIFFKQEELTYAEDSLVKKHLARLAEIAAGNVSFAEAIGKIYDEGIAVDLMAVILKPHEPTPFHTIWNYLWAKIHNVSRSNMSESDGTKPIIHLMKNSEILEVLADFFVLNTSWMKGLEGLEQASVSGS